MENTEETYRNQQKIYLDNNNPKDDENDDEYASQDEIDYIMDIMFPNDDDEENQTYDSIFGDD